MASITPVIIVRCELHSHPAVRESENLAPIVRALAQWRVAGESGCLA